MTGIVNSSGETVVTYSYSAWGEQLSCTGSVATTLGALSPLRYRGYVYDQETGLYYLQSRYYNPAIGRFINADGLIATGQGLLGNNMFAYCLNNPSNFVDPVGLLAYPGEIHNAVIRHIVSEGQYYSEQTIIYGGGKWGRADIISEDGYVWDVTRDKPQQIKNDIVQSFSLKKSSYVPSCTIDFGVCPLCHPQPIYFDAGPFDLEHCVVKTNRLKAVWMYNRYDEASINECIEKMMAAFDVYAIPLFEQSVDCSTALCALALLEERKNEVSAQERSIFGLCKPANEINGKLFDSRYYYLSLKAKNISFAKEFLIHNIAIAKDDLKLCDFPPYNEMENRKIQVLEHLQYYTKHLEQLECENWSYFEELLVNNESAMLTELSKNYPQLFKGKTGDGLREPY